MNPPEANDPLEALLRTDDESFEDGGFTARVLAALPRRRRTRLRPALLLGATVLGSVLAAWWLPWKELSPFGASTLPWLNFQALLLWLLLSAVLASLVAGAMAAFQWED